jgi:hypothetical protein
MDDLRPERDVRREIHEDEEAVAEDRDYADWVKDIGPEDMDRETVMENLEDYGFEVMDEDTWVSNPTTESDMPDWVDDETEPTPRMTEDLLEEQLSNDNATRPVEDVVIDRLDGDEPDEDDESTITKPRL